MDTRLEYILQCEKAEEIQNYKIVDGIQTFDMGDWVTKGDWETHSFNVPICLGVHDSIRQTGSGFMGGYLIWLPRVDQLQKMVGDFNTVLNVVSRITLVNQGIIFASKERRYDWILQGCTSMEQLWLAFVMKECYKKKWANGEWIALP